MTSACSLSTHNLFPPPVHNGNGNGLLPDCSEEFLVKDALCPSDVQNRTDTDVDEDLHFAFQVLSAPLGYYSVRKNWFVIAVEQSQSSTPAEVLRPS